MAAGNLDYPPAKGKSLPPRVRAIIAQVAADYETTPEAILGRERWKHLNAARREAMIRVRWLEPTPSYPAIGRWFGRNHATIIHACRGMGDCQASLAFEVSS